MAMACAAALLLVSACGDDDDSGDGGAKNTGDGGGAGGTGVPRPPRAGSSGAGAGGGGGTNSIPGDGEEGAPCAATADCGSGLSCVDAGGFSVGVCARACKSDADCGLEVCVSRSGLAADLHCENVVRTEFDYCGAIDTAVCSDKYICLQIVSGAPLGVCVVPCDVGGASDAGTVDEDAGVTTATCSAEQSCLDLEDPTSPGLGFCISRVGRGEQCGYEMGALCDDTEICGPSDPSADNPTDFRCRQDCTADGKCDSGTCVDVQGQFAYCTE